MAHISRYCLLGVLAAFICTDAGGKNDNDSTRRQYSLTAGVHFFRAFSQKKNEMVMKTGYPVFQSTPAQIGGGISIFNKKTTHRLRLNLFHSPQIISDDGLGNNFLLQDEGSHFTGIILEHQLQKNLWKTGRLDFDLAPLSGIDLQYRNIRYSGGSRERTSDVNIFLGIRTFPQLKLNPRWVLRAGFDSFFYLPYLNTGKLKKWNSNGQKVEETSYHAFYYRTRLHASLKHNLAKEKAMALGYKYENTVGFANRNPRFYIDELVHHRLDTYHTLFVRYFF